MVLDFVMNFIIIALFLIGIDKVLERKIKKLKEDNDKED